MKRRLQPIRANQFMTRMEMIAPTLPKKLLPILAVSQLGEAPLDWRPGTDVPPPFHQLLVHDHDMTSELERFHGDSLTLDLLNSQRHADSYLREVLLRTARSGIPVEYGIIEIHLDACPAGLRPLILAGNIPLGVILNSSGLSYRSEPQGFFTVPAEVLQAVFPQSPDDNILFGRYNHLILAENTRIARILEILPPARTPD